MAKAPPRTSVYYDRTASDELRHELQPNGAFGYLVDFVNKHHLADIQFRSYPHTSACRATLYVGLTKVLDVHERHGAFWLQGKVSDPSWDPAWSGKHPASWFTRYPVAGYVDGAVRAVADQFTKEGAVQAMLCTRAANLLTVVDREAVVGFVDDATRQAIYAELQDPLTNACTPTPSLPWFVPKRFGGELDLLAIDDAGRVLIVEIKPGSATSGITWAPIQATFYARLFRRWAAEAGSQALQIINAMVQQRVELGLSRVSSAPLVEPLEFVPIVAIGGQPKSPAALPRMRHVQAALLSAGVGEQGLEVWEVEEAVRARKLPVLDDNGTIGPWTS